MNISCSANNGHSNDLKVYLKTGRPPENRLEGHRIKKDDHVARAYLSCQSRSDVEKRTDLDALEKATWIVRLALAELGRCLQIAETSNEPKIAYYAASRALKLFDESFKNFCENEAVKKGCTQDKDFIGKKMRELTNTTEWKNPQRVRLRTYVRIEEVFRKFYNSLSKKNQAEIKKVYEYFNEELEPNSSSSEESEFEDQLSIEEEGSAATSQWSNSSRTKNLSFMGRSFSF